MGIILYSHNARAYDAVLSMLNKRGKAAVIHPTGTGKSFIAFKLCEDNPGKTVCWLSPSEYIFNTQLENLERTGAERPGNIKFFTYAKLMHMTAEEVGNIRPDYIVLDEFHRCGAEMWGRGVEDLLDRYKGVPLVGLSATAIRYLDNQRDMADELFDGNVASEISLGEAIVRGILNPPKYVLSAFIYKKDLDKYGERVKRAKNKAVRTKAERYLEALRRALEKSDGLDEVFKKHMTDRTGKYIVFCSNVEHLFEMRELAPAWFKGVDENAHIYCAYSENPETDRAFKEFKNDGSPHLKLLFCIDMLNEGIHVEDISGVILLRPTVSPIIYKQQIGRALSAAKKNNAVIFDVVLNIENLYSIGTLEEEMQVVMTYYLEHGKAGEIVNGRFKVTDEVGDCVALFKKLNDTLTASWDLMYEAALGFYEEHGNLEVPERYITKQGYSLGHWLSAQRRVRAGKVYGTLTKEQIDRLDRLGMRWESSADYLWDRNFALAKKYHEEHGNLEVKADEKYCGINLGKWISNLRTYKKSGLNEEYLTGDRIAALDGIGMIWSVPDYIWHKNYNATLEYYKEHHDLKVPLKYVSNDGVKLGVWLQSLKTAYRRLDGNDYRLTEEQVEKLNEIGMIWETRADASWKKGYAKAKEYYMESGNLEVPVSYVTSDGYKLGAWLADQRGKGRRDYPAYRQAMLEEIGMVWEKPDSWELRYKLAESYYKKHGDLNVPARYTENGVWLSKWLNEQKHIYNGRRGGKRLSEDQIMRLEKLGIDWNGNSKKRSEDIWNERFSKVKEYYVKCGNLNFDGDSEDSESLKRWVLRQRLYLAQGKLDPEKARRLESVGIIRHNGTDDWNRKMIAVS